MNRPEARNALSTDLISAALPAIVTPMTTSLCGRWCSPAPTPRSAPVSTSKRHSSLGQCYFEQFQTESCIRKTAEMATPIIGAINGPVFTGGLEMALGCDFLIASQRAVFADTHARVGILPGGGMTARLPQAGRRRHGAAAVDDRRSRRCRTRRADRAGHRSRAARSAAAAGHGAGWPDRRGTGANHGRSQAIYVTGSAAVTDPALAAEQTIAGAQELDRDGLGARYAAITERNRRQIRRQP